MIAHNGMSGRWRVWWIEEGKGTRSREFDHREQAEAYVAVRLADELAATADTEFAGEVVDLVNGPLGPPTSSK